MKKLLIINGPNLNMVGIREPGVYGNETLESINVEIKAFAEIFVAGAALQVRSGHLAKTAVVQNDGFMQTEHLEPL